MSADAQAPGLPEPMGRGEDPLQLFTRVYLLFLQGLFKQFPEGSYRWSDDETLSEIVITDQVPIPKDRIEQRPAIVAMRGPAQFANLSLDQMRKVDFKTGAKERTDLVSCTMSLNCIGKMGPEAQRIAWIVMSNVRRFKELLQRNGMHRVGEDVQIGPESPPGSIIAGEGDTEAVLVTVYSPFFFQWTDLVTPLFAPRLTEIELHLRAGLPRVPFVDPVSRETELRTIHPPTIRGRIIAGQPIDGNDHPIEQTVKT